MKRKKKKKTQKKVSQKAARKNSSSYRKGPKKKGRHSVLYVEDTQVQEPEPRIIEIQEPERNYFEPRLLLVDRTTRDAVLIGRASDRSAVEEYFEPRKIGARYVNELTVTGVYFALIEARRESLPQLPFEVGNGELTTVIYQRFSQVEVPDSVEYKARPSIKSLRGHPESIPRQSVEAIVLAELNDPGSTIANGEGESSRRIIPARSYTPKPKPKRDLWGPSFFEY